MRLQGLSCDKIAQKIGLSRTWVANQLNEWGYTARYVLNHHGFDTTDLKDNQLSGLMTKLFNDQNKTFEKLHQKQKQINKNNPKHCEYCQKEFFRKVKQQLTDFNKKRFCSTACGNKNRAKQSSITNNLSSTCANCLEEFSFTRKRIFTAKPKFCSPSCEKRFRKEDPTIPNSKNTSKGKRVKPLAVKDKTKGDLFSSRANWQSARSCIQRHACKVFWDSGVRGSCAICGYSKHVEVCHIKSVSSFPNDAKVSEINALDNLIGLCPNHHEEFDAGVLDITTGKKK